MRASTDVQIVPAYSSRTVLFVLPALCFLAALATDISYWRTSEIQWANFSAWLLAVGMAFGALLFIVELVNFFRSARRRHGSTGWWGIGMIAVALAVALANNFVHARDGWTSVVPSGLILSSITVALAIISSALIAHSQRAQVGDLQ